MRRREKTRKECTNDKERRSGLRKEKKTRIEKRRIVRVVAASFLLCGKTIDATMVLIKET